MTPDEALASDDLVRFVRGENVTSVVVGGHRFSAGVGVFGSPGTNWWTRYSLTQDGTRFHCVGVGRVILGVAWVIRDPLYRNLITSAAALCLGFALGFVVAQAVLL